MCKLSSVAFKIFGLAFFATSFVGVLCTTTFAQNVTTDIGTLDKETAEKAFPAKPPYSPYAGRNFPTRPYFGDTHTHTSFSMDAGAFGARLGPKDAYRFAKGDEVVASSGQRVKLSRPLEGFVLATSLFFFVFLARNSGLEIPEFNYIVIVAGMFSLYCYTREFERLGSAFLPEENNRRS